MKYGISEIEDKGSKRIWLAGFETKNLSRWVYDPIHALTFSTPEEAQELKTKKNLKGSILKIK